MRSNKEEDWLSQERHYENELAKSHAKNMFLAETGAKEEKAMHEQACDAAKIKQEHAAAHKTGGSAGPLGAYDHKHAKGRSKTSAARRERFTIALTIIFILLSFVRFLAGLSM